MRVLTIVGVALCCGVAAAEAQRANNVEFGAFTSFSRFDHQYSLPNRVGGGGRVGYFITDLLSLELEGIYLGPSTLAGKPSNIFHVGSASAVFTAKRGERYSLFALGGVSRIDLGTNPPYDRYEDGVHGGVGARVFLTRRLALRVDGRAFYRPESDLTGNWAGHVIATAGVSYMGASPITRARAYQGRASDRQYQWYWAGQGGIFGHKTNVEGMSFDPVIGGHWLITAKRTALYAAYEQSFFVNEDRAVIFDPSSSSSSVGPGFRDVFFSDMRRLMFGVIAFPTQRAIEPIAGLGFAMMQVLNPEVDCSGCTTLSEAIEAQDRAEDAASKAFFWILGGVQLNFHSKLNLFGHYILTSSSQGFLIDGNTHSLQAGVRYSFGTAKEGLTERN